MFKRQLVDVLIVPLAADDADVNPVLAHDALTRLAICFGSIPTTLRSLHQSNVLFAASINRTYSSHFLVSPLRVSLMSCPRFKRPLPLRLSLVSGHSSSRCLGSSHPVPSCVKTSIEVTRYNLDYGEKQFTNPKGSPKTNTNRPRVQGYIHTHFDRYAPSR